MIWALLVFAIDPSCSFESGFKMGESESTQSLNVVSIDSVCEGQTKEVRQTATLAYELGRDQAATLRRANVERIPTSYEEFQSLMEIADRKIKMQALRDEVADRDLRIQQMKRELGTNSQISR